MANSLFYFYYCFIFYFYFFCIIIFVSDFMDVSELSEEFRIKNILDDELQAKNSQEQKAAFSHAEKGLITTYHCKYRKKKFLNF